MWVSLTLPVCYICSYVMHMMQESYFIDTEDAEKLLYWNIISDEDIQNIRGNLLDDVSASLAILCHESLVYHENILWR